MLNIVETYAGTRDNTVVWLIDERSAFPHPSTGHVMSGRLVQAQSVAIGSRECPGCKLKWAGDA